MTRREVVLCIDNITNSNNDNFEPKGSSKVNANAFPNVL